MFTWQELGAGLPLHDPHAWATEQSLEMSLALVEALLDEVEARAEKAAVLKRTVQAGQAPVE
ncbi:hypothetical protein [Pseudomonas putida]|uniref:hypothetical protein n=1 Tax=Pseudomonas putida TaxID=303 RepID=UPI0023652D27|nr:hypothetical protein [Pseudomonas putida]MDD2047732.1 hypothetical protein [Pseudomonas putida]